ncbi:MAG: NAD(P)H-dependent oxidoreductase [Nakamurella sp.]
MTALDVAVILGTTRQGRQTVRISDWIRRKIDQRDDMAARVIDLRDHPLPFYDQSALPVSGNYGPAGAAFARIIGPADACVIVTPESNHGVPAVLKNALDHLYEEWNRKPLAVIGYGGLYGGVRAVEALRQYAVELQMVSVRNCVTFPIVARSFPVGAIEPTDPIAEQVADQVLNDLGWWAHVLRTAREQK